jgi:hypothetical protein
VARRPVRQEPSAGFPQQITFGYEAAPIKPLPKDWRSTYVHYARLPIRSELGMWWLWTDGRFTPHRPGIFQQRPNNLEGFAQVRNKTFETKLAPFVNQHVTAYASCHFATGNTAETGRPQRRRRTGRSVREGSFTVFITTELGFPHP